MKDREETIRWEMSYCQHYNPQPGQVKIACKAGVDIDKLERVLAGGLKAGPCIHGDMLDNPTALCPHWVQRTREQGEARADRVEASMNRMRVVMPVVSEWRTWTKKNRAGKQEVIDCPTGCGGKLHLSQSSYNGHVHGRCTSDGCVNWME